MIRHRASDSSMTGARALAAVLLALSLFPLAGCGERPQVVVYKNGEYQGKPDNLPWANQQFQGNETTWEGTVRARTQNQNEYSRVN